jgi:hypothetical protein
MFLAYYNRLAAYGVTDPAAQELVIKSLSDYYKKAHPSPLHVDFYVEENWDSHSGKNGVRLGKRGPEKLIRVANVA